jgi:PAS domain S-box-containing protein
MDPAKRKRNSRFRGAARRSNEQRRVIGELDARLPQNAEGLVERDAVFLRWMETDIGVMIWNLDGRILDANGAFLQTVQYSREDLVAGLYWTDLTPAEWRDRDSRALEELKATTTIQPYEKEYFRKDGVRVPVLTGGTSFGGSGDEGISYVFDLSGRRRPETVLQAQADLLNLTHDTIFVMDMEGAIQYWNHGAEERYGWTAEQAVGKVVHDLLQTAFPAPPGGIKAELIRAGRWEGELVHTRRDGTRITVASRWALQRDAQGAPVAILETNNDITERKRVEERLRFTQIAIDKTASQAFWITKEGRFFYVNEAACKALGYARDELLKMSLSDIDPGFAPDVLARHWLDLKEHGSLRLESYHRAKDGRIYPVEVYANYVVSDGEEFNCGFATEITERRRAEEKIRQHEMELCQILDFTPQLVAVFGPDRERLFANRPALDYFGVTLEEWQSISNHFWFYHPDDRERMAADVYAGAGNGGPHEFEARIRRNDGAYRWFLFRDNPLRDEQGRITRWYLTATDIEDRKRAEEDRKIQVWFLESLDRIARAMQGSNDLEQVMNDVLDAMLAIFECDRAWFVYPCDPQAPSWHAIAERVRPEFPGAFQMGVSLPVDQEVSAVFEAALASKGPVLVGPEYGLKVPAQVAERFSVCSYITMVVYPKVDRPYLFGLHQCRSARLWTPHEQRLFQEVGQRLADSLTSLLMFRSLRESERTLRQSEAYLAESQRLSRTGSWAWDPASGKIVYWSEEIFQIFGFDPHEPLPSLETWSQRALPEDLARISEGHERSLREKVDTFDEFRYGMPDGSIRHILAIRHPVLNEAGDVVKLVGTVVDITDRKRGEEALRLSNAYNRSLIEASLDPLVTIGPDGRITDVNAATESATGRSRGELIGTDFCDYFTEPANARAGYEQVFREGMVRDYPLELRHRDGRVMSVLYNASLYRDESGEVVGVFAAARDITERKRAEEDRARLEEHVRQAQKLESIGRLAGGVAHDFNNLLTVISGYAQMGLDSLALQHPMREPMGEISKAAARAAGLTRQLLTFSRRQVSEPKVLALNDLVQELDKMLRRLVVENIALDLVLDPAAGFIRADPGQIEQVIMNLVVNARDAMPAGGRLVIETARELVDERFAGRHLGVEPGTYAMLSVSDTGMGMSADVKAHLFEPFFTTKEQGKGTGLGLSIVYGIVKQSGGAIWIDSEAGQGTTVKMLFPSVRPEPEEGASEHQEAVPTGTETILLAEDEPGVRQFIQNVLTQHGYTVLAAADGREALALLQSHPGSVDLLLADAVMPGMGGLELASQLTREHPTIPVLLMSGYAESLKGHPQWPGAYLQKPFTPAALLGRLRKLLGAAKGRPGLSG